MRRGTTAATVLLVVALITGCSKQGCSHLPLNSAIQVQVPAAIQAVVNTFRVELCQGQSCHAVDFPSKATGTGGSVGTGIKLVDDAYDIALDRIGSGWKPGTLSQLTVLGTTKNGRLVLSHTDQFTFTSSFPNGKDCDQTPALTYSSSVGGGDLRG